MSKEVYFFKPVPKVTIWGGDVVKNFFGYDFFPDKVGQCWAFNALGKDANEAIGEHSGETLLTLFENEPELFNSKYNRFPFIISLVGPVDDLSIQVHPDTQTGIKMGYTGGKNEAWYFISTPDDYNIVYNHNALDRAELDKYINDKRWNELIRHLSIKQGEAVYIPAGTLHAMRKGAVVYEIQQAVDVTFRFYDYDRVDEKGNKRELQTAQAVECLHYDTANGIFEPETAVYDDAEATTFMRTESFTVRRWRVNGKAEIPLEGYAVATVTRGSGSVDGYNVKVGDNILITALRKLHSVEGDMEILMTME